MRIFGTTCCLLDVLSAFKANFVTAVNRFRDSGMSLMQVRGRREDPHVSED